MVKVPPSHGQIPASAHRISVFNSFRKLPNGNWLMKGEQMIICVCGFNEGFRVFADGDIAKTIEKHNGECELRK